MVALACHSCGIGACCGHWGWWVPIVGVVGSGGKAMLGDLVRVVVGEE